VAQDNPFKRAGATVKSQARRVWEMFDPQADREARDRALAEVLGQYEGFCRRNTHLMEWIDREADSPVEIDAQLMEKTARANTFKEIRKHIEDHERDARRLAGDG